MKSRAVNHLYAKTLQILFHLVLVSGN